MAVRPNAALDFDRWAEVARRDPAAFERMRREAIEALIARAPEANRERLRRLQWRIDQERRLARTPLAGCIRLSRLMWGAVLGRGGLRERLLEARARLAGEPPPRGALRPSRRCCRSRAGPTADRAGPGLQRAVHLN